jgi:hypothetical protein
MASHAQPVPPPPGVERVKPLINAANEGVAEGKAAGNQIGQGGFKAEIAIGGNMDRLIEQNLSDRLSGKNPKFSEEIMAMQKEKLFRETQGQTRRGRMALMADSARRGVFRSEATGTLIRDVEIAGMQQYSSGVRDLMIKKAEMDHEDMVQAINQSQQWLQGVRQYSLGLEQNAIAREQIQATMAAAAMSAAASMYAADRGLEGSRAVAGASRAATQQAYSDSRAMHRDPVSGSVTVSTHSMQQEQFMQQMG